jgi:hypothetical protein
LNAGKCGGMTNTPVSDPTSAVPRKGMFRELLSIHALLRRDLQSVRRLADAARDGLGPEEILAEVRNLETNSPLWRLKFGCLHYCRFVHAHHSIEDVALFPMVRRREPSLNRMVDRLEADHRRVHEITDRIAAEAGQVIDDGTGESRVRLVEALVELEKQLLTHLALEEDILGPLLSTWDRWPPDE